MPFVSWSYAVYPILHEFYKFTFCTIVFYFFLYLYQFVGVPLPDAFPPTHHIDPANRYYFFPDISARIKLSDPTLSLLENFLLNLPYKVRKVAELFFDTMQNVFVEETLFFFNFFTSPSPPNSPSLPHPPPPFNVLLLKKFTLQLFQIFILLALLSKENERKVYLCRICSIHLK
jgi:hypothetical protein